MNLYDNAMKNADQILDEDQDVQIANLKAQMANLQKQIEPINDKIEKLNLQKKPYELRLANIKKQLLGLNAQGI